MACQVLYDVRARGGGMLSRHLTREAKMTSVRERKGFLVRSEEGELKRQTAFKECQKVEELSMHERYSVQELINPRLV